MYQAEAANDETMKTAKLFTNDDWKSPIHKNSHKMFLQR